MMYQLKNNAFWVLIYFLINTYQVYGQKEKQFDTSKDYLSYLDNEFEIKSSDVFYLSTENDSLYKGFEKFGILVLINDNKLATIYEVAEKMGVQCSPNKLMPKITNDAIETAFEDSKAIKKVILKNLEDGEYFDLKNKKIAIYAFSYIFGKKGLLFLNEKKFLENLGYQTIVFTLDGAYIDDINDIDKSPVIFN